MSEENEYSYQFTQDFVFNCLKKGEIWDTGKIEVQSEKKMILGTQLELVAISEEGYLMDLSVLDLGNNRIQITNYVDDTDWDLDVQKPPLIYSRVLPNSTKPKTENTISMSE